MKNQHLEAVRRGYPNAMTSIDTIDRLLDVIEEHVILVGGIFINGDRDVGSFCRYKKFDYIDLDTSGRRSLMEAKAKIRRKKYQQHSYAA
ncbi:hypothetical protein [Dyadobacter sp. OTU695]|uniref:hypothetical protein n=1 Tax=Dyadobacter sp. OTU695 TaxID=3043860 RepID=UPI00313E91C2